MMKLILMTANPLSAIELQKRSHLKSKRFSGSAYLNEVSKGDGESVVQSEMSLKFSLKSDVVFALNYYGRNRLSELLDDDLLDPSKIN